jgi:chromosome segregation ATPase
MDSLKNNVNDFYEKASEWSEMSETERTQFLNDNADLFSGSDGAELLKAFESNDYNMIQDALQNNTALNDQLEAQLEQVRQQIKIEEAYVGDARNEALIKQLKDYEQFLTKREDMFMASLDLQIEKEQEQLDTYREYLEEQQSALEESLNDRKEAYEKYFDAIAEEKSAEDYEEEANRLITNISKISTTSNADSQKQKADLEAQLEKLEEQRLEELREKAQEAMLENMDDTISEINDKFDKLLENNRDLLKVMTEDLENSAGFVSDLIASKAATGATGTEMQQYLKDIEATYGSALKDFD